MGKETDPSDANAASHRLRALLEVTQAFAESTTDYAQLPPTIAARSGLFIDGYCVVGLVSADGLFWESVAEFAQDPQYLLDLRALPGAQRQRLDGWSVPATVARTRRPMLIPELITTEWKSRVPASFAALAERHRLRAVVCVAMQYQGNVLGTLTVGRIGPRAKPLEAEDLELLQIIADHAAQALASAKLLEDVRNNATRMRALAEVTQTFSRVADTSTLFRTIVEQTSRFLGSYCRLGTVSADGSTWEPLADYADDSDLAVDIAAVNASERIEIRGPTMLARVVRTGNALLIPDVQQGDWKSKFPPAFVRVAERHNLRGFACVPIHSEGAILGTLGVGQAGVAARSFDAQDLALLQVLGDHAAQAIVNGRLLQAVRRELEESTRARAALERSEEKIRQVAKMEAVGRLAGGIAHDFNNMLSVVLTYSELAIEELQPGEPLRDDLMEIRRAGQRARELTQQLLAFSRQQVLAPRVLDLNKVLAGMLEMLKRLIGEAFELRVLPARDLFRCLADPGQIEQVVMNLVVNARDAMPNGGAITIETMNTVLDAEYVRTHPEANEGPHAVLCVSDTGSGMDRETLARIFDPFFTTKPQGIGTGLGLATVYGITKQSSGCVWVYSEPDRGTTFKVYLPRADGVEARPTPQPSRAKAFGGAETILLVEDDEQVRALVKNVLVRAGYHVIETSNGGEALLVCEQHGAKIHLLLTDVVMPRMNGKQVAERLVQLRPDLKVLYMSGYTENAIVHHGVLDSDLKFLQKPVTPDELLRKVREVLG